MKKPEKQPDPQVLMFDIPEILVPPKDILDLATGSFAQVASELLTVCHKRQKDIPVPTATMAFTMGVALMIRIWSDYLSKEGHASSLEDKILLTLAGHLNSGLVRRRPHDDDGDEVEETLQ